MSVESSPCLIARWEETEIDEIQNGAGGVLGGKFW